jgi:hypothetical protein
LFSLFFVLCFLDPPGRVLQRKIELISILQWSKPKNQNKTEQTKKIHPTNVPNRDSARSSDRQEIFTFCFGSIIPQQSGNTHLRQNPLIGSQ